MQHPVSYRITALAVLAIPLIIAGCASPGNVAPQAHGTDPMSLDAGAAIRAADIDAKWPDVDWWRAYKDPQLNSWVEAALAGNPTLAIAQARVRNAQALAAVNAAALAPQVNGNLSIQGEHWPDNVYYGPGPLADQTTWNNTAALSLSYHLDFWGRDRNATEAALDLAHARAADARAAQLEIEANVVRTYIDLSMNYALLDIQKSTLAQQQQVATLAHRRLQGGLGTQLEVAQAETPLPASEQRIDALEEEIALARNQLASLAGKGPGAGDTITRPQLALSGPAGLPSALPAELIGHRPDIVAARWTVAAQARGIDVAHADFYPNIDLLASIGGFAAMGPFFQFLHAQNGSWTVGPAASLPILDGGRLRAQLGAASAGYDEAAGQYNQAIVNALKQISDQVVRIRSLETQANEAQRAVDIATKNYQLARVGYQRGLTDYVNVLIAQTQQLRAQEGVARVQADRLSARATLVVVLGGGLSDPADGPAEADTWPASERRKAAPRGGAHAAAAAGAAPAAARPAAQRGAQPVAQPVAQPAAQPPAKAAAQRAVPLDAADANAR
ncbi:efflux transporter outer membrane subunit [Paraburkholderia humisilvae]|uniref:Cation efflux system protein CusC n=1 Tax=Paraburkholderia humisilvae TaxID=627669 RepID=A0A6J5EBN7_9BURK|nr:efflux transporter outer membrane subunit [Paraburkholderia humisilvae]CAB3763938.1 Cation efflux system protein CusC [Paraburkholderia humisilvae]